MTAEVPILRLPEREDRVATSPTFTDGHRGRVKPILDQLAIRKLSFRQLAYLSKEFALEHGNPDLSFNHVSVSHWFNGRRNPSPAHRQTIATLLQMPLALVDGAFDSRQPLLSMTSAIARPAIIFVIARERPFEYPLTLKPELDLSVPAVYEGGQWERMFSVYPANLKRHLNGAKAKLFGWVPDHSFKPLIPHSQCLMLLKRPTVIPALNDSEGLAKRIWFIEFASGKVDVRFMYRDGAYFVTSKPNQAEQRFRRDAVDPLGYVTGTVLFRLELRSPEMPK
jgi:hypothetical protein